MIKLGIGALQKLAGNPLTVMISSGTISGASLTPKAVTMLTLKLPRWRPRVFLLCPESLDETAMGFLRMVQLQ